MFNQKKITMATFYNADVRDLTVAELSAYFESKGLNAIEANLKANKEMNIIQKRLQKDIMKSESEFDHTINQINHGYIKTNLLKMFNEKRNSYKLLDKADAKLYESRIKAYRKIQQVNIRESIKDFSENLHNNHPYFYNTMLVTYALGVGTIQAFSKYNEQPLDEYIPDIYSFTGDIIAHSLVGTAALTYKYSPEAAKLTLKAFNKAVDVTVAFAKDAKKITKGKTKVRAEFLEKAVNYLAETNPEALMKSSRFHLLSEQIGQDYLELDVKARKEKINKLLKGKVFNKVFSDFAISLFSTFKYMSEEQKQKNIEEMKRIQNSKKKYKRFGVNEKISFAEENVKKQLSTDINTEDIKPKKESPKKVVRRKALSEKETARRSDIRKKNRMGMRLIHPDAMYRRS